MRMGRKVYMLCKREIVQEIGEVFRGWTVWIIDMDVEITGDDDMTIGGGKVFQKGGEFSYKGRIGRRRRAVNGKQGYGEGGIMRERK